jgi:phage terminase large subunit
MLYRMLRTRDDPKQLPFKLLLMTTNPDGPGHHLYRSFMRGEITRWKSRHEDNPIIQESDLARLRAYTGVRRQRMYEGLWVAAEGAVFQNFDASVHIAEMPRLENGAVDLVGLGTKRVIAGWDWGYTSPGALLVAAVNGDRRIHIVAQVYRNLMPLDWWVEEIAKLHRLYGIERLVVDPSRPECIDAVNRKLSPRGSPLAIGADNQRTWTGKGDMAGIDLLRQMLEPMDHDGRPQLLIGEKSLIGLDDGLHQMALPCSLEDEFPLLRYAPLKEGQRDKEHTDPSGVDHALDAARYIANHVRRISPTPVVPIFKPGAAGDILGHAAELERIRAREASFRSDDDDY